MRRRDPYAPPLIRPSFFIPSSTRKFIAIVAFRLFCFSQSAKPPTNKQKPLVPPPMFFWSSFPPCFIFPRLGSFFPVTYRGSYRSMLSSSFFSCFEKSRKSYVTTPLVPGFIQIPFSLVPRRSTSSRYHAGSSKRSRP